LTAAGRQVSAGFVGRPHGLDGSFYVERVSEPLAVGAEVTVGDRRFVVERRAGTDDRPIVRLSGVADRDAAGGLRGEPLLVEAGELGEGEYLSEDLIGCEVPGVGTVRQVLNLPSCDVLEVGDEGVLVPLVSDAVTRVDIGDRRIEVDRGFLGLEDEETS
jgi:16S rRNA processing protein RimM